MSKSRRETAMRVKWLGLVLMALAWSVTAGIAASVDGFDYPVGPPDGTPRCPGTAQCAGGWQNVQDFRVNNHLGEDWNFGFGEVDLGKPVYAVANGVVTYARDVGGDGSWKGVIIIQHTGSDLKVPGGTTVSQVTSMYAHLDVAKINNWVSSGSIVSRGQQIGVIGPTPVGSTGPHLHFEIRSDPAIGVGPGYSANTAGWIDPSDFINANRNVAASTSKNNLTQPEPAQPLQVVMAVSPNPVRPGELLTYSITVANRGAGNSTEVTVTAVVPDNIIEFSAVSGLSPGGGCPGSFGGCEVGETATWQLGTLAAGQSRTVTMSARVLGRSLGYTDPPDGTLIQSVATVAAARGFSATDRQTVVVDTTPLLRLQIEEDQDPVPPGGILNYTMRFANGTTASALGTVLRVPLPTGTSFASATEVHCPTVSSSGR